MTKPSPSDFSLSPSLARRLECLLDRAEQVLSHLDKHLLPVPRPDPDWQKVTACRWKPEKRTDFSGCFLPVRALHPIRLSDLTGIDEQKTRIVENTRQFIKGRPANNVLLTGARGSGKSSLVKAVLNEFAGKGLRLVEVDKNDLIDLADIVERLAGCPEKFLIFCDDLSFDPGENIYKPLKSALDGSIAMPPDNVLIYATSNRRHLMPEFFSENLENQRLEGEIHPGESTEEKISLSERFGLWISFYPFDQDHYLAIVAHWLKFFGFSENAIDKARQEALNWALGRGSRSGRVAWQFARDYAGREGKGKNRATQVL